LQSFPQQILPLTPGNAVNKSALGSPPNPTFAAKAEESVSKVVNYE